jgi:hypothetical protein
MATYAWERDVYITLAVGWGTLDGDFGLGVIGWSEDHVVIIAHGNERGDVGFDKRCTMDALRELAFDWAEQEGYEPKRDMLVEVVCCYPNRARNAHPDAWHEYGIEFVGWWDTGVRTSKMDVKNGLMIHVYPDTH